jgi:hypothetical protein
MNRSDRMDRSTDMPAGGNESAMRVNRRFLYWGIFLVALGGVLVVVDLAAVDPPIIVDILRLWPLALVAIGLGLVLRHTRFNVPGGMLAAAAPGLLLGAGFALVPSVAVDCGAGTVAPNIAVQQGEFDGPARVAVATGCGELVVGTAPGAAWRFDPATIGSRAPSVEATSRSLAIGAAGDHGWHFSFDSDQIDGQRVLGRNREAWRLTLPTTDIEDLAVVVNAGLGQIGLPGAHIDHLDLTTNAGMTSADLTGTSLASLSGTVNAGLLAVSLPADADMVGSLQANAGELQVCVPSGLGVRIHRSGALSGFKPGTLARVGADWESPDYASAAHHADLTIHVNLGNVEIDPIGGCK